jgi:hypothetical protein
MVASPAPRFDSRFAPLFSGDGVVEQLASGLVFKRVETHLLIGPLIRSLPNTPRIQWPC